MSHLTEYQHAALQFRLPTYSPEAAVMGLLAESGEVAGIFQKLLRGDFDADVAATKLHKELGDVLWHVAAIAHDNGWHLDEIANSNIEKLTSRQLRNVIAGSGDDR